MTRRHHPRDLRRAWLDAEAGDNAAAAEAALGALFAALPLEAPGADFAAGVLARLELAGATAAALPALPARRPIHSAAERLAAAWLAAMSLGTLVLASLTVTVLPRVGLTDGLRAMSRLVAETWQWIGAGLLLWERMAEAGRLVAKIIQVPEIAALMLLSLLTAAAAFRLLHDILVPDRNQNYAKPQ